MTESNQNAKEYQRIKKKLSLMHLFLTPALLCVWVFSGLAVETREIISGWTENPFAAAALFFTIFSVFFLAVDTPLAFYSGYIIEHRYKMSNLSFAGWFFETAKRSVLSFIFALVLITALYSLIRGRPADWWFWAWAGYSAVSWIMGKLFPVVIVPLFYRYEKLPEGELKDRILSLLKRFGLPAANLFTINLSKTTKKANAAFMGIGKTKRVVLSDTLVESFSPAEIEQVVAHELGHFKHRDIWKQLGLGLVISLISFFTAFIFMRNSGPGFGIESPADPAGLPLLMLMGLIVSYAALPLTNGFSRICEFAADRFALDACRDRAVFISMMEKLGKMNLSDPEPDVWYEFIFYSHPSIKRRIAAAQKWSAA